MARRQGLGKGLNSLMGGADAEVAGAVTTDAVISIDAIKPNKGQPRKTFDEDALEELTDSIRQHGVLQPILLRKTGRTYEIVAGERRYQAAKRAGLTEIPAVVREISNEDVFKLALIENLQREDLNPIEEALGFRTLIKETGMTQAELGKVLSKSRPAIANSLRLLELPDEVQDMMTDGSLTAGHARAILAVASEEGRTRLAHKVVEDGLTVRQTESLAPLFSDMDREPPRRTVTPQSYKRAARQLRLALNTNVRVKKLRNKNKIEIEFASDEDLERIVARLSELDMAAGGSD